MKKNSGIYIVMGLLVIALCIMLGRQFIFQSAAKKTVIKESLPQAPEVTDIIRQDKAILSDPNPKNEALIVNSLKRLSFSSPEEIEVFITKNLKNPSVEIQAAATEAAGAGNSLQLEKILKQGLENKNSSIRIAVLKGLMRSQNRDNEQIIKKYMSLQNFKANDKSKAIELLWAKLVLTTSTYEPKKRELAVNDLVVYHNSIDPDTKNNPEVIEATHKIFNVFQDSQKVIELARTVSKSKTPELREHASKFLKAYDHN